MEKYNLGQVTDLSGCETRCYHGNRCTSVQARGNKIVFCMNSEGENLSPEHQGLGSEMDGSRPVGSSRNSEERFGDVLPHPKSSSDLSDRKHTNKRSHIDTINVSR